MLNKTNEDKSLFISNYAYFIQRKNNIIAFNKKYGYWMKFSKECYDYLKQAVNENLSQKELLSYFINEQDKLYMNKLIDNLRKIKVVLNKEEEEKEKYFKLDLVNLVLTNRCNLYCKHCGINAINSTTPEYFNTMEMKKIIDKILYCHPETLVITGGEPLIRDDFTELVMYIKSSSDVKINLMTNATLISEEIAYQISKYVDFVDISLDGYDELSCSFIRGNGVFDIVINNIKLLQQYGVKNINLSMVSIHFNPYEENNFLELCKLLKVKPILRRLSLVGRAKFNKNYLENNSINLDNKKYLNLKPTIAELKSNVKACSCPAGVSSITICANGDIIPCIVFSEENLVLENISNINNLDLYLNSLDFSMNKELIRFIESSPYGKKLCNTCDVRYFCWTCPYEVIDYIKNRDDFDKHCIKRKNYFYQIIWGEDSD